MREREREREREIYRDGSVSGAIEHNNLTSVGGWWGCWCHISLSYLYRLSIDLHRWGWWIPRRSTRIGSKVISSLSFNLYIRNFDGGWGFWVRVRTWEWLGWGKEGLPMSKVVEVAPWRFRSRRCWRFGRWGSGDAAHLNSGGHLVRGRGYWFILFDWLVVKWMVMDLMALMSPDLGGR